MTRGTFYLITATGLIASTEFNGDMYPKGYGDEAMAALSRVNKEEDFTKELLEFNKLLHKYPEDEVSETYPIQLGEVTEVVFDNNTYTSDWTFFKNLTDKTIIFKSYRDMGDPKTLGLEPNAIIRFNFGGYNEDCLYIHSEPKAKYVSIEEKRIAVANSFTADEIETRYKALVKKDEVVS